MKKIILISLFCFVFSSFFSLCQYQNVFWDPRDGIFKNEILFLYKLNNGSVFAGAEIGGLYRSDGDLFSWKKNGFNVKSAHCMAESNSGDLFVSTNDLFRSTDNGKTWFRAFVSSGNNIFGAYSIEFNNSSLGLASNSKEIWLSKDDGYLWSKIADFPYITDACLQSNNIFATSESDGIYRSIDSGDNWSVVLDIENGNCITADQSGVIYVGFEGNGIYRSTDSGNNWSNFSDGLLTYYLNLQSKK